MSFKRMRLSSSTSSAPNKLCEGSATSDAHLLLKPIEMTTTVELKVSNSIPSLVKMPLALLIKLTNYLTVREFSNYTLVNRRLSTIMGQLESVEARHSENSLGDGANFAMSRTL